MIEKRAVGGRTSRTRRASPPLAARCRGPEEPPAPAAANDCAAAAASAAAATAALSASLCARARALSPSACCCRACLGDHSNINIFAFSSIEYKVHAYVFCLPVIHYQRVAEQEEIELNVFRVAKVKLTAASRSASFRPSIMAIASIPPASCSTTRLASLSVGRLVWKGTRRTRGSRGSRGGRLPLAPSGEKKVGRSALETWDFEDRAVKCAILL